MKLPPSEVLETGKNHDELCDEYLQELLLTKDVSQKKI